LRVLTVKAAESPVVNRALIGQTLKVIRTTASAARMQELAQLLGSPASQDAVRLSVFFGLTIGRDLELPRMVGMVMDRTLMLGHEVSWARPFHPDEEVDVAVVLADIQDKPDREIATIESVFTTPTGEEIQRQSSTFVTYKAVKG
jgi:hypothetical protein